MTPVTYIYITLYLDVWFLFLTLGGGLVCFVTVGGVYVYAVECMTMCKGYSPHYLKRMCVLVSGSRSIFWVDNLLPCTLVR